MYRLRPPAAGPHLAPTARVRDAERQGGPPSEMTDAAPADTPPRWGRGGEVAERRGDADAGWEAERAALLGASIADLGLRVEGSPVQSMVERLYAELDARGLVFRPPVYLTDEWGCPEGVPAIGVPFFYADRRLERLEREHAVVLEEEDDPRKILRHEAGHAFNYAYRLYDRPEWRALFGPYSRPYRERFHVNPFSREFVRHILGWYAQKHPDEDFAECFAVWLTPGLDWHALYRGWPVLRKLEYVDAVMAEVGPVEVEAPPIRREYLPVEALHSTLAEYYAGWEEPLPLRDPAHFDGDLRNLFRGGAGAPGAGRAFLERHRRELVRDVAYWTGELTQLVRQLLDHLAARVDALDLSPGPTPEAEAATLVELTAFLTAVVMNYRHTDRLAPDPAEPR